MGAIPRTSQWSVRRLRMASFCHAMFKPRIQSVVWEVSKRLTSLRLGVALVRMPRRTLDPWLGRATGPRLCRGIVPRRFQAGLRSDQTARFCLCLVANVKAPCRVLLAGCPRGMSGKLELELALQPANAAHARLWHHTGPIATPILITCICVELRRASQGRAVRCLTVSAASGPAGMATLTVAASPGVRQRCRTCGAQHCSRGCGFTASDLLTGLQVPVRGLWRGHSRGQCIQGSAAVRGGVPGDHPAARRVCAGHAHV